MDMWDAQIFLSFYVLPFKCDSCCNESFSCKKLLELHNKFYREEHRMIEKLGRPTYPWEIASKPAQIPCDLPAPAQYQPQPAPAVPSPLPGPSIANQIPFQPITALHTPLPTQNLAAPIQPSYMQPGPTTTSPVQLQHLTFQAQPKPLPAPVPVSVQRQSDRFNCHLCERTFSLKHHLKRHIDGVHGNCKFKCEYCYKTFSLEQNLKRHIKGVHQGFNFECKICGYETIWESDLKRHNDAKHKC